MSTMTDVRVHSNYVIQTGERPVHHTHEEYMDVSAPAEHHAVLTTPNRKCPSAWRDSSREGRVCS